MHSLLSWPAVVGLAAYVVVDRLLVRTARTWVAKLVRDTPFANPTSAESITWKQLIVLRKREVGDSFETTIWLDHTYYIVFGVITAVLFCHLVAPGHRPLALRRGFQRPDAACADQIRVAQASRHSGVVPWRRSGDLS
jgi:hypothetical protein